MDFVYGGAQNGLEFLKGITDEPVAIYTDNDLDGFVAGLMLDRSLEKATTQRKISFLMHSPKMVSSLLPQIREEGIKKVIFSDLCLQQYLPDVAEIARLCPILILDHHDYKQDLNTNRITFLKTHSEICAALIAYELATQMPEGISIKSLDWLVAAACIADYGTEGNIPFLRAVESRYRIKNRAETNAQAFSSDLGQIATVLSDAMLYFHKDRPRFYEYLKNVKRRKDALHLGRFAKEVQSEIERVKQYFETHHEVKDGLLYAEVSISFPVTSAISTDLSEKYPGRTLIIVASKEDGVKISARRQDGEVNLPELLRKAVSDIPGATAGGHRKAAGASITEKDIKKFHDQLLELV